MKIMLGENTLAYIYSIYLPAFSHLRKIMNSLRRMEFLSGRNPTQETQENIVKSRSDCTVQLELAIEESAIV